MKEKISKYELKVQLSGESGYILDMVVEWGL